jgi:hypothetical protein
VIEYAVFAISPVKVAFFSESETVKVPCPGVRVTTKVVDVADAVQLTIRVVCVLSLVLASSSTGLAGPVVVVNVFDVPTKPASVRGNALYILR